MSKDLKEFSLAERKKYILSLNQLAKEAYQKHVQPIYDRQSKLWLELEQKCKHTELIATGVNTMNGEHYYQCAICAKFICKGKDEPVSINVIEK
jgi:hypothetical protein